MVEFGSKDTVMNDLLHIVVEVDNYDAGSVMVCAVVIGIRARIGPIHPICVRLDLNLTILTAME
jgi:hypothetical protein